MCMVLAIMRVKRRPLKSGRNFIPFSRPHLQIRQQSVKSISLSLLSVISELSGAELSDMVTYIYFNFVVIQFKFNKIL